MGVYPASQAISVEVEIMFLVNDLSSELGEVREINIGCRGGGGGERVDF